VRSVFSFGDTLHVILNEELYEDAQNSCQFPIINYQFKEIQPTIEDCFMALS